MKRLLLVLILINSNLVAQSIPDGFWGIPFGTPYSKVKQLIEQKSGCVISAGTPGKFIFLEGCPFGGYTSQMMGLSIVDNEFASASVTLGSHNRSSDREDNFELMLREFKEIEANIISQYGKPSIQHYPRKEKNFIDGTESYKDNLAFSTWVYPVGCKNTTDCRYQINLNMLTNQFKLDYEDIRRVLKGKKLEKNDY
jgi:hypothetical protein